MCIQWRKLWVAATIIVNLVMSPASAQTITPVTSKVRGAQSPVISARIPVRVQSRAAPQHVHTRITVQRVQTKSPSPRTVGAHTATPAIAKNPISVPVPAKIAMSIPAPELLAAPSEPDCAFDKTRADADDRQKLDYERQCYRHAEMIIRARLKRLQGDVEQIIEAVKSGESMSAIR
jgi:hypothetical protein